MELRSLRALDSYYLRCTDTSVWRGMLVSDTALIRYGTDTAPIRIRYATWRIVDLYGMLTSRYGSDTSSIRSRYGRYTASIRLGIAVCREARFLGFHFNRTEAKITPERAEDLVFVHSNLRLLSRKRPEYKEGEIHMWDVGSDAFDSMDLENAGVLEIANLSLDEPDLEGIIFTHDE
ncbi:hypothetical protein L3X38_004742 [Prunus dulcis]|uniref:Uncharacterized protein n=1 Tax=Prunus dulcis TaxID=3755 RepID=A0AAD4ZPL8_PRUDU|nr:hypothetical protein L3X38_004742 [Prunus dulcis]